MFHPKYTGAEGAARHQAFHGNSSAMLNHSYQRVEEWVSPCKLCNRVALNGPALGGGVGAVEG
jgi:hypothetical protein